MNKLAVNYHLTRNCNMKCKYCFATFEESCKSFLTLHEKKIIIEKTSKYFDKMTFVGGEPLLDKDLKELIIYSKNLGMTTMLVSNGSLITENFLIDMKDYLDWVSLSIDSLVYENNIKIGRENSKFKGQMESYMNLITLIVRHVS